MSWWSGGGAEGEVSREMEGWVGEVVGLKRGRGRGRGF